jgi:hypothetical protein
LKDTSSAGKAFCDPKQKLCHVRVPEKNNSTSCLSFGPSTALHPPTRISICAAGCAL